MTVAPVDKGSRPLTLPPAFQAARAAEWALQQGQKGSRHWGRFASEQEWRAVANRRRDGAAPQTLFLADRLQELRSSVSSFNP